METDMKERPKDAPIEIPVLGEDEMEKIKQRFLSMSADEKNQVTVLPSDEDGHDLWEKIVAKHGVDRYRTVSAQYKKLMEEMGELAQALMVALIEDDYYPLMGVDFDRSNPDIDHIRKEYADVGLTLYGLGKKLGLNLMDEMRRVVDEETRTFDGKVSD